MVRDHLLHVFVILLFLTYPGIANLVHEGTDTGLLRLLLPQESTMQTVLLVGLFAVSFDFISGYTGYLSFGHSLFFGIGALTVLVAQTGGFQQRFLPSLPGVSLVHDFSTVPFLDLLGPATPLWQVIIGAVVFAMVVALVTGLVSFRLSGVYFAMITLGVAEVGLAIANGYIGGTGESVSGEIVFSPPVVDAAVSLGSGGSTVILNDLPLVDPFLALLQNTVFVGQYVPTVLKLRPQTTTYLFVGLVGVLFYFTLQRIIHSPFGRVMIAIRENEERASAIGYNTYVYKNVTYVISAAFGAIAGVLQAPVSATIAGDTYLSVIDVAGTALIGTIIGGIGTLAGPLFGILFEEGLTEMFDIELAGFLGSTLSGTLEVSVFGTNLREIVGIWLEGHAELYVGLVFILFVLFVPGGLLGTLRVAVGDRLGPGFGKLLARIPDPDSYDSRPLARIARAVPVSRSEVDARLGAIIGGVAMGPSALAAFALTAGATARAASGVDAITAAIVERSVNSGTQPASYFVDAPGQTLMQGLASPGVLNTAGTVLLKAHLVPIGYRAQSKGITQVGASQNITAESGDLATVGGPEKALTSGAADAGQLPGAFEPGLVVMAAPVVALVAAGFVLATRLDVSGPAAGTKAGFSLVVGYLPVGLLVGYLAAFETTALAVKPNGVGPNQIIQAVGVETFAGFSMAPDIVFTVVVVGVLYPVVFGGIGGAVAGVVARE